MTKQNAGISLDSELYVGLSYSRVNCTLTTFCLRL